MAEKTKLVAVRIAEAPDGVYAFLSDADYLAAVRAGVVPETFVRHTEASVGSPEWASAVANSCAARGAPIPPEIAALL